MTRGFVRRWMIGALMGSVWVVGGWAPGLALAAKGKSPSPAAARAGQDKTPRCVGLELAHDLGAETGARLGELVARFNEGSKDCQILVADRGWKEGPLPPLAILGGESEERLLAGTPRYRPLHEVMKSSGEALLTLRPPAFMTRRPVDAQGRLLALPVALSTPVLYYNRDAFRKVGLNPDQAPGTWFDLQQALGTLIDAGQPCPYTVANPSQVIVENTSAWHNEPTAVKRGKGEALSINGMLQIKHLAMMASWYRARYLQIFGRGIEAQGRFESGECAVIAAPSSSWHGLKRQANFDIGVAPLPYHDDYPGAPQNTLAEGSSLWVAAGRTPAEYKTIARFVRFWLEPDNQVAWQRDTGYLPLSRTGVLVAQQSSVLKDELESVRVALSQLSRKPATEASSASALAGRSAVRNILDEELEAVWADRKPAKEALDTAVTRAAGVN